MMPSTPRTERGRLYLVPAPLDFGCLPDSADPAPIPVLPETTLATAARLTYWLCENAKTLRASLKRIDRTHPLAQPLQALHIAELPRQMHKKGDHATAVTAQRGGRPATDSVPAAVAALLEPCLQGHDMGLASEAGMPAIADPGSSIVRAAHDLGLTVIPLVGPVSLMLALAASGLNGQSFAFVGYLPQDAAQRATRLRELEKTAHLTGQSQIFIETPYRNAALLDSAIQHLQPHTRLAVSWGLTLEIQGLSQNVSAPVAQWRKNPTALKPAAEIMALPAVYTIGC